MTHNPFDAVVDLPILVITPLWDRLPQFFSNCLKSGKLSFLCFIHIFFISKSNLSVFRLIKIILGAYRPNQSIEIAYHLLILHNALKLSNHFFFQPILFSYKNETVSAGKIKIDQREKYRKKVKKKERKKER